MPKRTIVEIKVAECGELRESVKQRLQRVRDAFRDAKTHAEKHEALNKLMQESSIQSTA